MKILLVDDNPRRYQRLIEQLTSSGITREAVDIVTCAMEARNCLQSIMYDLMIVDIVLPLRAEEEPQERHSLDLLRELIEFEEMIKPKQIVGLSAHDNVAERIAPFFRENLWTVITYVDSNDGWMSQVLNCAVYLKAQAASQQPEAFKTDVAIVCALADPELQAILQLPWSWTAARPLSDVLFGYDGSFVSDGNTVSVVAAAASRMGMVSAALASAQMIELLRPRFLIMAGVCAGIKGKVNLGDVLLIDPSWDWQSGKRVRDSENARFSISPHQIPVRADIRSRFEQLSSDRTAISSIAEGWHSPFGRLKLIVGPVASGSAVLADGEVVAEIRTQNRDLCGIEMEAYGVYSAAAVSSRPRPTAFAIKSVCDFADPDKNDDQQKYAAYTSANVIRLLLEAYFSKLAR